MFTSALAKWCMGKCCMNEYEKMRGEGIEPSCWLDISPRVFGNRTLDLPGMNRTLSPAELLRNNNGAASENRTADLPPN